MIKTLGLLSVVAVMATAVPAAADAAKGYRVTYLADRNHYCVRPVTAEEADRLGIALYKTECRSAAHWASMGLRISLR